MPAEEEHHLRAVGGRRHRVRERDVRVRVARAARVVMRVRRGRVSVPPYIVKTWPAS